MPGSAVSAPGNTKSRSVPDRAYHKLAGVPSGSILRRHRAAPHHTRREHAHRQTFAEPPGDVARASARRTERLFDLHRDLGLASGGEAGARLAIRLGLSTSPDTLLLL